jgi:23S rRNA (cytidine1920-2'-O)/16S rRNA (cytidine1409-2'-O)-methyltransferase
MVYMQERIDQALVKRGLCESRTEAQLAITSGWVLLNDVLVSKLTTKVSEDSRITVLAKRKYVSRGGDKLDGALHYIYGTDDQIKLKVSGKTVLDVGSSTGGFTDCMLSYGAAFVTAVDVGTLQMSDRLRNDRRVSLFENTDIREFSTTSKFDYIVADLSFIPLDKALEAIISFGTTHTQFILLIKPQFEVGKGNTKKGLVKDLSLRTAVLEKYERLCVSRGFENVTIFECSITGGDGNQEYFLCMQM